MNSEEFRETFLRNDREGPTKAEKAEKMAENNAWERNSRRGNSQPRAAAAREANPVGSVLYRTSGVIFFHRLLHSYTRHIEGGSEGERDIVPSTQDLRPRTCSLRQMRVSG